MKLDKETLIELLDYIEHLNDSAGLKPDTYLDITTAIHRKLDALRNTPNRLIKGK